jgi:hypothetical protein
MIKLELRMCCKCIKKYEIIYFIKSFPQQVRSLNSKSLNPRTD